MKRGILLILTALMLSLLSVQALGAAQLTALPHLEITLINQEPEPAAPGSFVELKFMIENLGGDSAQEVELQLVENYPFTVYEDSNIKFLGTIQGRQMDDEGQIVKFRVRIDDNAIDGEHVVQLKYRHKSSNGKTSWIKTDDIAIDIRAEKPFL